MSELVRTQLDRTRVVKTHSGPGRTKQSFLEECDVNNIMKKWHRSGELTHLATRKPTYGDFSNPNDYLAARLKVQQAQADFDSLSSRIRDRMNNNPAELLAFMADPANEAEAVDLGLISKPAPTATPPATEPPAEPPPAPAPTESPTPIAGGD